ncbi:MAG: plasmid mobilization relaxosome protein MobC [Hyphomicrobiaceae bacterium]
MCAAKNHRKAQPLSERIKVQLTVEQRDILEARAEAAGITLAAYMRQCALVSLGGPGAPKRPPLKRKREQELTFAEIHEMAMQVRKVGINLNQLAHQANSGLVPIKREEIVYIQNRIQTVLSEASAAMERAFR